MLEFSVPQVIWAVMIALLVVFEVIAIRDRVPRNTWSAWVWQRIMPYLAFRLVFIPLWTWLSWHWFIEAQFLGDDPVDFDDLIAVAVGILWAFQATTRRDVGRTR